jgi:hypothetical protein
MNSLLISEKNRINQQVKDFQTWKKCNEDAEFRLMRSTTNVDFNTRRIKKMRQETVDFDTEIEVLKRRLEKLQVGELNKELKQQRKIETACATKKAHEKRNKKLEEIKEKEEKSKTSIAFYKNTLQSARKHRYSVRSAVKGYDYLLRVQKSLPVYIRNNLDNMPNNKGYVWRGVQYFGKKPPERNNKYVLFENKKGKLYIHEWTPDFLRFTLSVKNNRNGPTTFLYTKTYEKKMHGIRKLVSHIDVKPESKQKFSRRRERRQKFMKKLTPSEARARSRKRPDGRNLARPDRRNQARPDRRNQTRPDRRNQARPDRRNQARPDRRNQARPDRRNQTRPDRRNRTIIIKKEKPRKKYNDENGWTIVEK